jgi:hypothetical protein
MKKLLLATTLLAGLMSSAQATDKMSAAGVPAGTWCETAEGESDGWIFFTRGNKKCDRANDSGLILILKANGDFILTGLGDEMVCKVNPKTYFKGWADYTCKVYGASIHTSKRTYKFTTSDDQLGLSAL